MFFILKLHFFYILSFYYFDEEKFIADYLSNFGVTSSNWHQCQKIRHNPSMQVKTKQYDINHCGNFDTNILYSNIVNIMNICIIYDIVNEFWFNTIL